ASQIGGSVPHSCAAGAGDEGAVRLGNPSGVTVLGASVSRENGSWRVHSTSIMRTCRRLMDGHVYHL
ncbi:MAG TPA: PrpF family protein, partial [Rhizobiales bacterium]|nr:PrpF family protein [Hyphomicrobiales bacterium]